MYIFLGIILPFLGTTLGSAMVFFLKNKINNKIEKFLLGLASGVMIAASVWSLLIPSMEMAEAQGVTSWIPSAVGFVIGVIFLLSLDYIVPHKHNGMENPEGPKSKLDKNTKLFLAVTLHNIPEGMAVGVLFASILSGSTIVTITSALILSIGIAIQNFPEGAIISIPLKMSGKAKMKSFGYGVVSGIVEPIAAILTLLLTYIVAPILPYLLSFAAGAMIFVVVEELIPDAHNSNHSNASVIGLTFGFVLMMVLDVALG